MVKIKNSARSAPHKKDGNSLPAGYDPKQVEEGVKVLFEVLEKTSNKKTLFEDEGEFICIQVSFIRIPAVRKKHYRILLPNGFLKNTSEVCLFVRDLSNDKDKEIAESLRHFKNKLAEADVTCVNEIITVTQLMQEYKTYEMRRRLASRFDIFLADGAVSNWLNGALGKNFHRCRKQPSPVDLEGKHLKERIEKALRKTTLTITGTGPQCMVKVGNTKQSVEQICQNIEALVKKLTAVLPGKWGNVRSLHIRTDRTFSVPLYFTFVCPNNVKVPKLRLPKGSRRKLIPAEKGELSTLPDGYEVVVLPDGNVKVKGKKTNGKIGWLNDDELKELGALEPLEDNDEEMEEGEELKQESDNEGKVESTQGKEEAASSDSEDEENGVEAAEDAYLEELSLGKLKEGKKRKVDENNAKVQVKKSKKIPQAKKGITSSWKVEVLGSGNDSDKCTKGNNEPNKLPETKDEASQEEKSSISNSSMKGKLAKKIPNDNSQVSIDKKTDGLNGKLVKNGIKEKVSGNKLGKAKKRKSSA